MRRLAAQYPRYGYRRIRIFLKREGHVMSPDRTHRLWRQAGLQVPRRRPRRRVATSRPRPLPPTALNHVWAYDFVFDTCANNQTLKCQTVVDEWTRECLADGRGGDIEPQRIKSITKAFKAACRAANVPGRILHDLRRTAVRNLDRAGVPMSVAMAMVGHKTDAIYRRYHIVDGADLRQAAALLDAAEAAF